MGNKSDLQHLRGVTTEDGQNFAAKEGLLFMETSALKASNVDKALQTVLQELHRIVSEQALVSEESKEAVNTDDGKRVLFAKVRSNAQRKGCCS